jgi:superfamily II DNA or RNA helicase
MTTNKADALTLKDRLSRLTFIEASKLLGENGAKLIRQGGKIEIDPANVQFDDACLRVMIPLTASVVAIQLSNGARRRLLWSCSSCSTPCIHVGAVFSMILEDKALLGLAVEPSEDTPLEHLTEPQLLSRMLAEREERARKEKMTIKALKPDVLWSDYLITSAESGKTYRVALRGWERGDSYCTCPDFKKNTLGTCKHILFMLEKVRRKFPAAVRNKPYQRTGFSVHLHYGKDVELRILTPRQLPGSVDRIVASIRNCHIVNMHDLLERIRKIEKAGLTVNVYPDAEEYINQQLFFDRIRLRVEEIRKNPAHHPLRQNLLKVELLPYQLDGIAFAVGAGRAILADEMGLGKTIQGIGMAELLKREAGIRKVLIICPASVKSQWCAEIRKFSDSACDLVAGSVNERAGQYAAPNFFTVCNYEQVMRDIMAIERASWDLIILDEGQRIKNWEAKTSKIMKCLRSPFALVLSGTPLENRLDELFSVAEFIDGRRLGPAFHFFHRHRVVNEFGKVLGYKNLDDLRKRLAPILLRRTRQEVMKQLPPRTTEIVRIAPTGEQQDLHAEHMRVVSSIVRKKFLTEMDLLRLRKSLLMCRMAADSTYLLTKETPAYSSKLEKLDDLFAGISAEKDRKTIVFSEWTTMLNLIEPILAKHKLDFVRLEGSVPQKKRQALVNKFQHESGCRVFLTTNAGATGLNLQAANTVINVDLPWNPAMLEQRIGRAHRMGQKRPVQVFVLVTEGTIEENLLKTLSAKHQMALAALDSSSQLNEVSVESGMEELKRRLEVLIGAKPDAAVDVSEKDRLELDAKEKAVRRENVSKAGGQLLASAFSFLAELVPQAANQEETQKTSERLKEQLSECLEQDEQGRMKMTITLPDPALLNTMANALARLVSYAGEAARSG